MSYCIYLRKSRADLELEAIDKSETLARHEKILLELAKNKNIAITKIYKEIVSGENISSRPIVQELLNDIDNGMWEGVLVVEIERLARGDTIDQGVVAQSFKFSNTLIITPTKTYDPRNEFDEEYFEFGLFMSRREYKTINRRLQQGRLASIKEGKFVSSVPPYGYKREKIKGGKGYYLVPNEEEALIIQYIFKLFCEGDISNRIPNRIGPRLIAKQLEKLNIKTRKGGAWTDSTIKDILRNETYIGLVCWNKRSTIKSNTNGEISLSRPRNKDYISFKGLHTPIITDEIFELTKKILTENTSIPVKEKNVVKNPLAGIVKCAICGKTMQRRPYSERNKADGLICTSYKCANISSDLYLIEKQILLSLEELLKNYKIEMKQTKISKETNNDAITELSIKNLYKEIKTCKKQMSSLHDLLEQNVYDISKFIERSKILEEKLNELNNKLSEITTEKYSADESISSKQNLIKKIENVLKIYETLPTAAGKNKLLKEVINKIEYLKIEKCGYKSKNKMNFNLTIYPKLN